ncbi:MAG: PASTA domain-containing protein [Gaiellaceae bacterium]
MTNQPPPPDDAWPTPEDATVVREDTLVGAQPPGPPPPGGPPADRRIGAGMLLALGALALVAIGILAAWFLTHRDNGHDTTTVVVTTAPSTSVPPKVSVPHFVGLKEQEALVRLGQVGLRPHEVFKPAKAPKGVVISQKPPEGTEVRRGSEVTLVVDSGAPKVAVPDVIGDSLADAQTMLDSLGLRTTKTEIPSDKPAGTVLDVTPKPGAKLAKGSTVTLTVAKQTTTTSATTTGATTTGATTTPTTTATTTARTTTPAQPTSSTVPNVVGKTEAQAATALANVGILASVVFVPGTDPLGTVVGQAKPAGTTVPFHSHVQINVSRGPNNNPNTRVPDVVGQTLQQAIATLNAAHLRLLYLKFPVTSRAQAGKVVQQSPLDGAQAPQNAQVIVYLGAYKAG